MIYLRFCWKIQSQMFLLVSGRHTCATQRETNMASLNKALKILVKHFPEYRNVNDPRQLWKDLYKDFILWIHRSMTLRISPHQFAPTG